MVVKLGELYLANCMSNIYRHSNDVTCNVVLDGFTYETMAIVTAGVGQFEVAART